MRIDIETTEKGNGTKFRAACYGRAGDLKRAMPWRHTRAEAQQDARALTMVDWRKEG